MSGILTSQATHSGRLERWLGRDHLESMSVAMKDWYGPPIAVAGVPGKVFAHKGGDFRGTIHQGSFAGWKDRADEWAVSMYKRWRRASLSKQLNTGFASFSDLVSEGTVGGKRRDWNFNKVGPTGVVAVTSSLYRVGAQPVAGAGPANAAAGTAFVDSDQGGMLFTNPNSPDTLHFVRADVTASVAGNTLLLYDLIFGVNKTMASTANEAVTGVPTRWQGTTGGADGSAEGNFLFIQVGGTQLAATAHNWVLGGTANGGCTYTDQSGNTASALPAITGNSAGIVDRLDHPTGQWFAPLASGDTGIKALTKMECSASVATGVIWFMMGHPIAMIPIPIANMVCTLDGVSTAFNLVRIVDDACLQFLEICKPATTATTYNGIISAVAG